MSSSPTESAPNSHPTFLKCLVSGGIAGMSVDITLYPLDTLKTRLQVSLSLLTVCLYDGKIEWSNVVLMMFTLLHIMYRVCWIVCTGILEVRWLSWHLCRSRGSRSGFCTRCSIVLQFVRDSQIDHSYRISHSTSTLGAHVCS